MFLIEVKQPTSSSQVAILKCLFALGCIQFLTSLLAHSFLVLFPKVGEDFCYNWLDFPDSAFPSHPDHSGAAGTITSHVSFHAWASTLPLRTRRPRADISQSHAFFGTWLPPEGAFITVASWMWMGLWEKNGEKEEYLRIRNLWKKKLRNYAWIMSLFVIAKMSIKTHCFIIQSLDLLVG